MLTESKALLTGHRRGLRSRPHMVENYSLKVKRLKLELNITLAFEGMASNSTPSLSWPWVATHIYVNEAIRTKRTKSPER